MVLRQMIFALCVAVALFSVAAGQDGTGNGDRLFEQGHNLLKQAKFDEAFEAFRSAAEIDPGNKSYAEMAMLLSRVQKLRDFAKTQGASPKWDQVALSLHAFYHQNEIYSEALALDRLLHAKLKNATSASLLAESLLALGQDGEALDVLGSLDEEALDGKCRAYQGIALARLGRVDEARKTGERLPSCCSADPALLFDMARLNALLGEENESARLLGLCLEQMPQAQHGVIKRFAENCPDLKAHLASPAFVKALATPSKIQESGCSSEGCGSCPNSAGCSKKTGASEKEGCDSKSGCTEGQCK